MKILGLFIGLFVLALHAETVPLPTSVLGVDDLLQEIRGPFTTKISELGKNYITHISDQVVIFSNSEPLSCNGSVHATGDALSKMQYSYKVNSNELIEKATYTGCNNDVSLIEDVVSRGTGLTTLPIKDFLAGKRNIDLKDNENYRLYRISNFEGDEIFKVLIERTPPGKVLNFFILGQKFMSMVYEYKEAATRLTITYYGYNIVYERRHGTWKSNYNIQPQTLAVLASKTGQDQIIYFDQNNNRISLANFLAAFNTKIMNITISTLSSIIKYHAAYFPVTGTTQTGAQSQRFLEELRIAQNRLLNNIELNLVKKLLQDYVTAAESGLIIDNRPKN